MIFIDVHDLGGASDIGDFAPDVVVAPGREAADPVAAVGARHAAPRPFAFGFHVHARPGHRDSVRRDAAGDAPETDPVDRRDSIEVESAFGAGEAVIAGIIDQVAGVGDAHEAREFEPDVGKIEAIAARLGRQRVEAVLTVRKDRRPACQPGVRVGIVRECEPLPCVGADLHERELGKEQVSAEERVLEDHEIVAFAVDDHVVGERNGDASAVTERNHVERPLQHAAAFRRTEHDARQLVGSETGRRTRLEHANAVEPGIAEPVGGKRRRGRRDAREVRRARDPCDARNRNERRAAYRGNPRTHHQWPLIAGPDVAGGSHTSRMPSVSRTELALSVVVRNRMFALPLCSLPLLAMRSGTRTPSPRTHALSDVGSSADASATRSSSPVLSSLVRTSMLAIGDGGAQSPVRASPTFRHRPSGNVQVPSATPSASHASPSVQYAERVGVPSSEIATSTPYSSSMQSVSVLPPPRTRRSIGISRCTLLSSSAPENDDARKSIRPVNALTETPPPNASNPVPPSTPVTSGVTVPPGATAAMVGLPVASTAPSVVTAISIEPWS